MFFANGLCMRRLTLDFFRWALGPTDRNEMKRLSICSLAMTAILSIAADAASAADPKITVFYGEVQGDGESVFRVRDRLIKVAR